MKQYLTTKQVAERYQVHPLTVWRWECAHEVTGFPHPMRIHRRKFWTAESLDEWDRRSATVAHLPKTARRELGALPG
jgi:predicted DNA-binding transcriptional regulator AlpA